MAWLHTLGELNMVRELGNATARQTARARAQLKALLGEVKLIPTEQGVEAEIAVGG